MPLLPIILISLLFLWAVGAATALTILMDVSVVWRRHKRFAIAMSLCWFVLPVLFLWIMFDTRESKRPME